MKTSFYFVLWITIYPILALFHNQFLTNNSFIVALAIVWGLSWWLNRVMPKTIFYEKVSQLAPIMEDIYTSNVGGFYKRLASETRIEIATSIYFLVALFTIGYAVLRLGVDDWLALIVFGLFTFQAIWRSVSLSKGLEAVRRNPTAEQCAETAVALYSLNYQDYQAARQHAASYAEMLPPRPRHFKAFLVANLIFAVLCGLLGLVNFVAALVAMFRSPGLAFATVAIMYLLYGALAVYFGVKDFISIIRSLKTVKKGNKAGVN